MEKISPYSLKEEIFNSIIHGVGIIISIAALITMVFFSSRYGNTAHIISSTIFGLALVLLYTASTLYHSFQKPKIKHTFKIIDHSCIYILIAGTYTPFMLVTLRGTLGWTIFSIVWSLTLLGILFKVFFINRFQIISTIAYILMGWLIIFALSPLYHALPETAIFWLVAGGIIYTLGTIFYAWDKLPFNHAIWHSFVLAGSICHFFAIMFYVVPLKAS
ncbi:MAG: hemolysin D [Deltaproteobacteria bacterium HGW-Deltaproteobacteria-13]|jgi:hemolysin III|nr:MAG: hemolysin D [Deltaproteobacteria bacterium HGW-Deltaproteobacteria-13]